jgi:curli biogenesis system outer membrane secretion channel CsgG
MKKIISALLILLISTLFTACTQKVRVKALKPAEVEEMSTKKKIAIMNFTNDDLGLSSKVESLIAKHKLEEKRYFTVLSRKDIKNVLKEQKLQSSELMDEKTVSKIGGLIGAQALINGDVSTTANESYYYEDREKCLKYVKDKGCVKYKYYKVRCNVVKASVSASINIVDTETAGIIYADNITRNYNGNSCTSSNTLSKGQALENLSNIVAKDFVYKLTPHYVYFNVELLDSVEFELSDLQEREFDASLKYIEAGRYDKAEKIMTKLNASLNGKSYVVAYDLGVIKESRAKFDEAKQLYKLADDNMLEPIDAINRAVLRIDKLISDKDKANKQINRK